MTPWPFPHDWSSSYITTYSFKTEILVSRSGLEQRRARRYEPRRTMQTTAWDGNGIGPWLWTAQADTFNHHDPVSGKTSIVRLPDTVALTHPTSGVTQVTVTFQVEPGTDTFVRPSPDVDDVYDGRAVMPFAVEWSGGVTSNLSLPRQTVDFDAGRIAVTRPVAFGSRTTGISVLETGADVQRIIRFFLWARGRQYDFWMPSPLDDLHATALLDDTVTVRGAPDRVDAALRFETVDGNVFFRSVIAVDGDQIALDQPLPVDASVTVRRLSWARVGRFASDDLSVEWLSATVGRVQVQTITLPYYPVGPAAIIGDDVSDAMDYYGTRFFRTLFGDLLDYAVNVQIPEISA